MDALPGDAEHRARHRVRNRLRRRMAHAPEDHLAERRAPPFGGRLEGRVSRVEAGDQPGDHQRGGLLVGPEQRRGPSLRAQPGQRPHRLDRFGLVQQDLQRVKQPDIDIANQLVDELGTNAVPP